MHNNFYFLRQLTRKLTDTLPGFTLSTCYSQSKDELILQFVQGVKELNIKALLQPHFSSLYFPDEISRARRNSVDLFQEAIGLTVQEVVQYRNERAFLIQLENSWSLLFKLHGNRSNILLMQGDEPYALFRNKLVKDWNIRRSALHRDLPQNKEAFMAAEGNYKKLYPTFGPFPAEYLEARGYAEKTRDHQWELLSNMVEQLEKPERFLLVEQQGQPALSLLPVGKELARLQDPIEAINHFFIAYTKEFSLQMEKQAALQQLAKEIKSSQNYLEKTGAKLYELQNSSKNREIADILMANLHAIPPRSTEVTLFDFYNEREVTISLKEGLSPQKNAENFYRKAKNQQLEEKYLQENLAQKEEKVLDLKMHYEEIESKESLKDLRKYLKEISLPPPSKRQAETLPYRDYTYKNFAIWVGKGATQNDAMLRYHAHKNDLWLHAKDVSGSHVLLKHKPGQNFPADVLEKAASLAAWYSKRKSDTLCPVICTPRKWVRKLKGAAAGAVVVEKEEQVLLVQPSPFN